MGTRLRGMRILLSASEPEDESDQPSRSRMDDHVRIDEAVLCLARAVFSEAGSLVFAGPPSISSLLAIVASEYAPPLHAEEGRALERERADAPSFEGAPVWIFQSAATHERPDSENWLMESLGYARIRRIQAVTRERPNSQLPEQRFSQSRAEVQRVLLEETRPAAMVAVGGTEQEADDARQFLDFSLLRSAPIYTIESTGGTAARLRQRLNNMRVHDVERDLLIRLAEQRPRQLESPRDRLWMRSEESEPLPSAAPSIPYALVMQVLVDEIARGQR